MWPQIGRDIVAVRYNSTQLLLAVLCDDEHNTNQSSVIFPLVHDKVDMGIMKMEDTWDEDIRMSLTQNGGGWEGNHACILEVTAGEHRGCRTVGVGSNIKKRNKAARLAMFAMLVILERGEVAPELQHFVVQASFVLSGGNNFPSGPVPSPVDTIPCPPPMHHAQLEAPVYSPPESGKASGGVINLTVPRECMDDPFTELRVWEEAADGRPAQLWPYCKNCKCWTDANHHWGNKHQNALANRHDYEVRPGMDVETIVRPSSYAAAAAAGDQHIWTWHMMLMQTPWQLFGSAWPTGGSVQQPLQSMEEWKQISGARIQPWTTHAFANVPWTAPAESDGSTGAPPSTESTARSSSSEATPTVGSEAPLVPPPCRWSASSARAAAGSEAEAARQATTTVQHGQHRCYEV